MSVRLHLSSPGIEQRGIGSPARVGAPAAPVAASATRPRQEETAPADTGWYAGLAARQARLNREVTGTQQALAWLDTLLPRLRDLARRLGIGNGDGAAPAALAESLDRLRACWERRHAESAGTLDADLEHFPAGDARQSFRIRGFDLAALAAPEAETLVFHPRGVGRRARVVVLAQGDLPEERVRRLGAALAPDGIRVRADESGQLLFSIPESDWPALREQLLVQGGGRRFPAGWPGRVVAEALPGAIDPAQWSVDDAGARQQAFKQASAALIRAEHARNDLATRLAEAGTRIREERGRTDPERMRQAADAFASGLAGETGFRRLATAGACLRGLGRQRVASVLGG